MKFIISTRKSKSIIRSEYVNYKLANDQEINLADNTLLQYNNQKVHAFQYKDPGSMATIGRNKAVVDNFPISNFQLEGWMGRMGFYLLQLIGVENKAGLYQLCLSLYNK